MLLRALGVLCLAAACGCSFQKLHASRSSEARSECEASGGFWEVSYNDQMRATGYRCAMRERPDSK